MSSAAGPRRAEIWWASLAAPSGSEPGYRRPVLVIQADDFNRSRIGTVVVVALTSNLALGEAPGNVLLSARQSRLPKRSVANVSQILTLDKRFLRQRVGRLPARQFHQVEDGVRLVLAL